MKTTDAVVAPNQCEIIDRDSAAGQRPPFFEKPSVDELKGASVRGSLTTLVNQGFTFFSQIASMVILARLLTPADFGLNGMVAAITGCFALFGDFGLGAATIQRKVIRPEEISTVFWVNVGVGVTLASILVGLAPLAAKFYDEPRVFWVMVVSSTPLLFAGLGAQHAALLLRTMRYATLAKISITSIVLSTGVGVLMASLGFGYWALVGMAVSNSFFRTSGYWIAARWCPGFPRKEAGMGKLLKFGGTVTLNNLVVYLGYNAEKILLGRVFGAQALGLYGRAYQLLNLPLQQLHGAIYNVAFPALSAIHDDPERLGRAFLKGHALLLSLTVPLPLMAALFAEEIVSILLGPNWTAVAPILRLLAPTILVLALINPFGWFLIATGRTGRSLKMALVIAPVVLVGICLGLRGGPVGVALGYSMAMIILVVPLTVWALRGTGISLATYARATRGPLMAALAAAIAGLLLKVSLGEHASIALRFPLYIAVCLGVYGYCLVFIQKQKGVYADLLRHIIRRPKP